MRLVNNNNAPTRTKPAALSEYLELVGSKEFGREGNDLVLAFPGLFPEIAARLCGSSSLGIDDRRSHSLSMETFCLYVM
jgi:hypothetical protein